MNSFSSEGARALTQKVATNQMLKEIQHEFLHDEGQHFEARIRYVASSQIVTIPVKISRELELRIGDIVKITIEKKNSTT
jgi:hypothetical protein